MRTARLDHNPYARPAPITLGSVARPNLVQADRAIPAQLIPTQQRIAVPAPVPVEKPQPKRETEKVLRPTKPGQISNTQCSIRADWVTVVNRLVACQDIGTIPKLAALVGVTRQTISEVRNRHTLPGERTGRRLAELWDLKIGGRLPV